MRELGAGLLMLMVCGAIDLQTDSTIRSNALKGPGWSVVRDHEFALNPVPDVLQTLNRVPNAQDFSL
jgi:hypothetical protein